MLLALPAVILAVWIGLLVTGNGFIDALGNPVGADFAMFRIAGEMASSGQWDRLYDEAEQQRRLVAQFPGLPADAYLPYRYPPLTACLFAPLAGLPYCASYLAFVALSIIAWLGSWWCLVRTLCPNASSTAALALALLLFSPIFAQTIIDGQASLMWFALVAGCWCAIQRQRFGLAGMLLALTACKPNVALLLSIVLLVRYPRMLTSYAVTGMVMLGVTLMTAGSACLATYVQLARQLATDAWHVETPFWKVQSLIGWSELAFGAQARQVNLSIGLVLCVGIAAWWRHQARSNHVARPDWIFLTYAILVNALFNPYTPMYDLALLSLAAAAWVAWADSNGTLVPMLNTRLARVLAAALWIGPIVSQAFSHWTMTPLQLMPIAMLAVLVELLSRDCSRGVLARPQGIRL